MSRRRAVDPLDGAILPEDVPSPQATPTDAPGGAQDEKRDRYLSIMVSARTLERLGTAAQRTKDANGRPNRSRFVQDCIEKGLRSIGL